MNSKHMKEKINQIQTQETAQEYFYFVKTLSFELTRRCNMKCAFCSRGDAQNLDMSKEVIDKVLDEMEFFDLYDLRLNGGEPLLAKDGLIYLVNEIIRRGIKTHKVFIFTNGTIQDPDIKNALVKLGEYCKKLSNTPWGKRMKEIAKQTHLKDFYNINSYVSIAVSTDLHNNSDVIDQTIDFYNSGVDPKILHAANQSKSFIGYGTTPKQEKSLFDTAIILRGNGLKNFQKLYNEGYRKFSLHENDFNIIDDSYIRDGYVIFLKSFSVSATGAVFSGCLQPYADIDSGKDIICDNIRNCNNNLCAYIVNYCWEKPLTEEQSQRLDVWNTVLFYYKNGYTDCWLHKEPLNEEIVAVAETNIELMKNFEDGLKKLHELFPNMLHSELQNIGILICAYEMKDMQVRKYFLTEICGFDLENSTAYSYSDKSLGKRIDDYEKMYYDRQNTLYGNPYPSTALIQHATKNAVKKAINPATVTGGILLALLAGALLKNKEQDGE
ncbi:MAG: radical SAM protein [Ruminococcus sp.]|nr:radical SAM protein [Ruminococcus sp.]